MRSSENLSSTFLGFVPPHQLLAVLIWEHEEDMDRLGGFFRAHPRLAPRARNRWDAALGTECPGCWSVW
jgi:hypothetical protein